MRYTGGTCSRVRKAHPKSFSRTNKKMDSNFPLFGVAHLSILSSIMLLATILAAVQRRLGGDSRWIRLSMAAILLANALAWDIVMIRRGLMVFPYHLPIEFCDVAIYMAAIALCTLRPAFFDVAYYWALGGSTMALLTPDLPGRFPSLDTAQFFLSHGLLVAFVLSRVWAGLLRPRKDSVLRAMLAVNILAACDGAFDGIFGTNYMYLRAKPPHASLFDVLGPWPWYIAATEAVALALFLLLYLPFWRPWRHEV